MSESESARTTRKRARTESQDLDILKQDPEAEITSTTPHADSNSQHCDTDHGDVEVEHDKPEGQRRRDPEFWFSDGTVILVAKDIEFRIYRALLTEYSPVFRAMFAAPERPSRLRVPIDEQQSIACPVIRLTDSPEDLRHIVRAYVSRKQARFFEETKPSFYQISAYIRLGQKYKLDELYEQSLQFLKNHYTDDLGTWSRHTTWEPLGWSGAHSIGVVNLARFINEPSLLPTALMACVYMDAAIVQGFRREEDTQETLALNDLGRCFQASKDIREACITGTMRTFLDKVSPECAARKSCSATLRLSLRTLEGRMDWLMSTDPFLNFDGLLQEIPIELETCAPCMTMVKERHKRAREALWARLPELLDMKVPGWGVAVPQGEAAS